MKDFAAVCACAIVGVFFCQLAKANHLPFPAGWWGVLAYFAMVAIIYALKPEKPLRPILHVRIVYRVPAATPHQRNARRSKPPAS